MRGEGRPRPRLLKGRSLGLGFLPFRLGFRDGDARPLRFDLGLDVGPDCLLRRDGLVRLVGIGQEVRGLALPVAPLEGGELGERLRDLLVDFRLRAALPRLPPGDVEITHASHGLPPPFPLGLGDGGLADEIPGDDDRDLAAAPEEPVGEPLPDARLPAAHDHVARLALEDADLQLVPHASSSLSEKGETPLSLFGEKGGI